MYRRVSIANRSLDAQSASTRSRHVKPTLLDSGDASSCVQMDALSRQDENYGLSVILGNLGSDSLRVNRRDA
ncbi:MAG: hypothetical protein Phyf2KO_16900 [Phycisphaerales bacterium]